MQSKPPAVSVKQYKAPPPATSAAQPVVRRVVAGPERSPTTAMTSPTVRAVGGAGASPRSQVALAQTVDVARYRDDSYDSDDGEVDMTHMFEKRPAPSAIGFGRRKDQEVLPKDIPQVIDDVKVDVYVRCVARCGGGGAGARADCRRGFRCRPMSSDEVKCGDKVVLRVLEDQSCVKIKAPGHGGTERYNFDGTFGPECSQATVYERAAKPIVDNVLRGMNCCMFAYGQTGTGECACAVHD